VQPAEEAYEFEPHRYGTLKGIPWRVCIKCGHVAFTNPFAMWIHEVGCDSRWHPQYRVMRVKLVRQHQQQKGLL
jgi:hypothetical protein